MSGRQGRRHRASSQAILLTSAQEFSDMRCARLQLIKRHRGSLARTAFSVPAMQKARPLLRSCPQQFWCAHEAWVPGPRPQPESPRRPVLGTCRDLWGWIFSTTSVTLGLYHNFHFSFPVWSADPGPGTLPGSVSRCGRKRAEATVTRRSPGPRFSMCHGQALQFTSSPLARTAPSRRGTRGRLSSRRLAHARKGPPVILVVRSCDKVSVFAWWRSLRRTWAGRRVLDARWPARAEQHAIRRTHF